MIISGPFVCGIPVPQISSQNSMELCKFIPELDSSQLVQTHHKHEYEHRTGSLVAVLPVHVLMYPCASPCVRGRPSLGAEANRATTTQEIS